MRVIEGRKGQRFQEAGMQWDDEGMNITVNPMEDVEKNGGGQTTEDYSDEDEESDQERFAF